MKHRLVKDTFSKSILIVQIQVLFYIEYVFEFLNTSLKIKNTQVQIRIHIEKYSFKSYFLFFIQAVIICNVQSSKFRRVFSPVNGTIRQSAWTLRGVRGVLMKRQNLNFKAIYYKSIIDLLVKRKKKNCIYRQNTIRWKKKTIR